MTSVEKLDDALSQRILENFKGYTHAPVLGKPGDWILQVGFLEKFKDYQELPLHSADVFLLGHPKTGTTWLAEMIWLLKNDCDTVISRKEPLHQRFLHLEVDEIVAHSSEEPFRTPRNFLKAAMAEQLGKSGRLLKSHLPFAFLPSSLMEISKMVYIARNPYDVVVSFYHHMKKMPHHQFQGKISDLVDFFVEGNLLFSPFHRHVLDAWERRDSPNLHFVFYEDLKKDLRKELEKLAEFLGVDLPEEHIPILEDHLSFQNFRNNSSVNMEFLIPDKSFIRKGEVGDWRNHLNNEAKAKIDVYVERHFKGSGLKFTTHL